MKGFLKVDEIHRIYYEVHENPNGACFLFMHGGPGLGFTSTDLEFFNLNLSRVILFDQRGSGKSLPKGELRNNTSFHLIEDISKLLDLIKVKEVILFGGSWGSTLALLYAIKYPRRVKACILRGYFGATQEERNYFEKGGTRNDFPLIWERFANQVPGMDTSLVMAHYFNTILNGSKREQETLAFELNFYGTSLTGASKASLEINNTPKDFLARARILAHYSVHNFFIADGFIEQQIHVLKKIPIEIVQGLSDAITLVSFPQRIAKDRNNIRLHLVEGGHSSKDLNICLKLKDLTAEYSLQSNH